MKTAACVLAAALAAASPAIAQPSRAGSTSGEGPTSPLSITDAHLAATVTPASNATGCPAVVAAEATFSVSFKLEGDRSLVARFLWSDRTISPVPVAVVGRVPNQTVTYRVRQSRLFTASTSGSFSVSIQSARGRGETDSKSFTVTCRPPITVVPGALQRQSPVPAPAR
ncbi:MAG: hypothetical protein WCC53_06485 [Thermoanaerobaculia bacterium]